MIELNKLRSEIDETDKKISDLIMYRQSLAQKKIIFLLILKERRDY